MIFFKAMLLKQYRVSRCYNQEEQKEEKEKKLSQDVTVQ